MTSQLALASTNQTLNGIAKLCGNAYSPFK